MQSNPDTMPFFVHCSLWQYIRDGDKSKDRHPLVMQALTYVNLSLHLLFNKHYIISVDLLTASTIIFEVVTQLSFA
jgi:hypothetical protein